jgi:integrase
MELKRKLCFTSFRHVSVAQDFDYYLVFRDITAVRQIDQALVYPWIHAIPQQAPGTKNNRLKFARGFLHYLVRLGLAPRNPALQIPYLQPKYRKPYIYGLKELQRILEEARKLKTRYPKRLVGWTMETMIFLIYACGLRISEAINLRICDVDFDEGTLALWETKFHKERLLPFSPAVSQALKVYLARRRELYPHPSATDRFFRSGRNNSCSAGTIEWQYQRILVRCCLTKPSGQNPRLHDLRHTFAVHRLYKWYQEGHDVLNKLPWLSTYMGHSLIECTQVYLTIAQDLLREGDRRFQAAFEPVTEKALARAFKTQ